MLELAGILLLFEMRYLTALALSYSALSLSFESTEQDFLLSYWNIRAFSWSILRKSLLLFLPACDSFCCDMKDMLVARIVGAHYF